LERVGWTILKKYNAEIHSQSVLEAVLEMLQQNGFGAGEVERVEIDVFDVAYHIIGGGEEGNKLTVRTKEEADHSLPYMVAAAILDGHVTPEQYRPERIERPAIQALLRQVSVRPNEAYSRRFPDEMPCRVTIRLRDGRTLVKEKTDYEGFHTRPAQWETVVRKFERLSEPYTTAVLRREIADAVARLGAIDVADLTAMLATVRVPD
jgi:2-methylcitrate dehydratase